MPTLTGFDIFMLTLLTLVVAPIVYLLYIVTYFILGG
jgi:hypothetical protein